MTTSAHIMNEAVLCTAPRRVDGPFVLTAEHASRAVPAPWTATEADEHVLAQHWGWDIGVAQVTRAMASLTESHAVLARFSRLVCDANRAVDHPGLVVEEVEGHRLSFNLGVDDAVLNERIRRFHQPYHQQVARTLERRKREAPRLPLLLVMHSFTPVWAGQRRPMDVGVIFTPEQSDLGRRAARAIAAHGLVTAENEPYATGGGVAYSLETHGPRAAVPHLELELNQALIGDEEGALRMARALVEALAPLA